MGPVYDDLAELADYMLATPNDTELDARGCFSRNSTGEAERLLLELMTPDVKEFEVPLLTPVRTRYDDRWRLASCLQKAIRFGLPQMAMVAANGLYSADRAYVIQRLGVIAVEDVMAGSPLLTARALAMMGNPDWRKEVDERRLVIWLAKALAEVPKDRSAVEMLVMVEEDQFIKVGLMSRLDQEGLGEVVVDKGRHLVERALAAQIMAGPRFEPDRFAHDTMDQHTVREPGELFATMAAMGMTRWGLYVAAKTASRLREAMFVTLPFIDEWLRAGQRKIRSGPHVDHPMIGDVLSAAYDKYTRQGLLAIERFFATTPLLKQYMDAIAFGKRRYAGGVGVFLAEGGVLHQRVVYGQSEEAHRWTRSPERMHWLRDARLAEHFVPAVRDQLPALHRIRQEVVAMGVRP